MKNLTVIDWAMFAVLIVGGINWGAIGVMEIDLVSSLFGIMTTATRIVYGLVGFSALYVVFILSSKT
jgi:uncharacterized membrane protein YuzA (DUF378 family)